MAALDFPSSPTPGQTYTANGKTWTYDSTTGSWVASNIVTVPISTGVSGLGTGVATALGVNIGSAGAPVLFNGAGGTPTSLTLTNATGLPVSTGITGFGANVATFLAAPSSANLLSAVTDETGSGALVFGTTPTFTTSALFPDGTAALPSIAHAGDTNCGFWFPSADTIAASTAGAERMRIAADGTVGINSTGSANIQFNFGGTMPSSGNTSYSINIGQTIPSTSTTLGSGFSTNISTAAASFTCTTITHFAANQGTFGAGSAVTNQYGFYASANLVGAASNNFGYWSGIPAGTGRYNFFAAGTAPNYFAGQVGIGVGPQSNVIFQMGGTAVSSSNTSYLAYFAATIPSTSTSGGFSFISIPNTAAAAFTVNTLMHFGAYKGTIGAGSSITTQYGFFVESGLTSATNNYGFYSNIAAPTAGGTAASTVSTIASSTTTTTVVTSASHGLSTGQTVTISATANATALVSGATCTILTVGTTDFTLIGAASNTVGVSFTATGAGTGTGTVTLNQQGSGKTITVTNSTTFTYTSTTGTYAAVTVASGTVTPTTRWNFFSAGTADNYFAANVGIGTASFGTSASKVLALGNATAPASGPADTLQIYSSDLSAGNTMLSLYTEGTPVNANTTAATTHRIAIRVNGTVYYLLANTAA